MSKLKRYCMNASGVDMVENKDGAFCNFSDVEAILPVWVSVDNPPKTSGWYPVSWHTTEGDWMYWDFDQPFPDYVTHYLNNIPPAPKEAAK